MAGNSVGVLSSFIGSLTGQVIVGILLWIVGVIAEKTFGIVYLLNKTYHLAINSPAAFKYDAKYSWSGDLSEVQEEIKNAFRDQYGRLDVQTTDESVLKFSSPQGFEIKVWETSSGKINIRTSRISGGMRTVGVKRRKILGTLKRVSDNLSDDFALRKHTTFLYLPLKFGLKDIQLPADMEMENYEFNLVDSSGTKITIETDEIKIHSEYRDAADRAISKLIGFRFLSFFRFKS